MASKDDWTDEERAVAVFVESATAEAIADRIERELVCCDAFDGSGTYEENHAICYWGGAAAALAREYAGTVNTDTPHQEKR